MPKTRSALLLLAGLLPCLASAASPSRAELKRRYELASAAHRAGDYRAFLVESRAIAGLAPRSLRARYNLACAHALLGQEAESLAILEGFARMGVAYDLAADEDFARIKSSPGFRAVVERMATLQAPVGSSRVAFTVPEKDLLPEGVTHDPKTGAFFVSSVHKRKIVRLGADGQVTDFVPEAQDGLLSTLALAVDPASRSLWVSGDGVPQTKGLRKQEEGRSAVIEYDLDTGRRRRSVGPPASSSSRGRSNRRRAWPSLPPGAGSSWRITRRGSRASTPPTERWCSWTPRSTPPPPGSTASSGEEADWSASRTGCGPTG